eukprot:CAMPEP_0119119144 /NCGR_PEP_ID=MMETSP1310-20130426/759_1 /TAXON_ID=464262 /ORGANISM="Genus nov. species nov., Strain RCC2339" /LENGTH=550 /DNA_ID=CAMNT_0007108561 /DNA_START=21 /DNA_END=1673 /DNA_ORIENTATION=+
MGVKAVTVLVGVLLVAQTYASSHSEAPGITRTPQADNTDLYAFRSYETNREDYATFIMNVQPLQNPFAGPNYFALSDRHIYSLNIDRDGDAEPDLQFEFYFGQRLGGEQALQDVPPELVCDGQFQNVPQDTVGIGFEVPILDASGNPTGVETKIPLKFFGPIVSGDTSAQNFFEYYGINVVEDGVRQEVTRFGTNNPSFDKPFDNAGEKTFPDYENYADDFEYSISIPGCNTAGRVFVGQRLEAFHVNLGGIFDLVDFTPIEGFISQHQCQNDLRYINVDAIVLEVPISCVSPGPDNIIGVWSTVHDLCHIGDDHIPADQVSRLGHPLVNELVIGIGDKDDFNTAAPTGDTDFAGYVTHPSFPALLDILFRDAVNNLYKADFANLAPNNLPRTDLVATFLTGFEGVNQPTDVPVVASEILRLNLGVEPTTRANQDNLGVIGGDLAGFPNGRRPGDDVVDIVMRVAMGRLCYDIPVNGELVNLGFCDSNNAPVGNVAFTDGAPLDAYDVDAAFPYLRTPLPGSPRAERCAGSSFHLMLATVLAGVAAHLLN